MPCHYVAVILATYQGACLWDLQSSTVSLADFVPVCLWMCVELFTLAMSIVHGSTKRWSGVCLSVSLSLPPWKNHRCFASVDEHCGGKTQPAVSIHFGPTDTLVASVERVLLRISFSVAWAEMFGGKLHLDCCHVYVWFTSTCMPFTLECRMCIYFYLFIHRVTVT